MPSGLNCNALGLRGTIALILKLLSMCRQLLCQCLFDSVLKIFPVSRYELKPLDEMLVLCSDGVIDKMIGGTTQVVETARDYVITYGFDKAAEELCETAVELFCDDNVTAVLVRFCEIKPKPVPRKPSHIGGAFKKL